jgi:hypothetical protein
MGGIAADYTVRKSRANFSLPPFTGEGQGGACIGTFAEQASHGDTVARMGMTIRGTLGAIGLLVVAGTLLAQRPLEARAIGGLNTVTVSPGHGRANFTFQVTYAVSPCVGAAGLTIAFSWTALPPAGQLLGTATTDSTCRATLSTTPPVNAATHQPAAPGSYEVFGYIALPTGTPTPNTEASASYTVDVTPASATASSSATARSSAAARPSATASSSSAASPSASAPGVSDEPGTAATAGAGKPAVDKRNGQPGWWTLSWPVILAAAVLALAVLAFLLLWLLGRRRARAAAGVGNDKAA